MGLTTDGVKRELKRAARKGRVPCAVALATASRCGITPKEAGALLDELGLRIDTCQLGLFGFGPGKQKRIQVPEAVSDEVAAWITARAEANGHVTCAEIFAEAEAEGLSRAFLAGACEKADVKIRACQLGAFY